MTAGQQWQDAYKSKTQEILDVLVDFNGGLSVLIDAQKEYQKQGRINHLQRVIDTTPDITKRVISTGVKYERITTLQGNPVLEVWLQTDSDVMHTKVIATDGVIATAFVHGNVLPSIDGMQMLIEATKGE